MPVLLDTGIVFAYYDRSDDWHERALGVVADASGPLLLPAPVIPEVDHLLGRRLGRPARRVFYEGLIDGSYLVVDLPPSAYSRAAEIDHAFADLELGFVDASLVALAEILEVSRIATTDRRDLEPVARRLGLDLVP